MYQRTVLGAALADAAAVSGSRWGHLLDAGGQVPPRGVGEGEDQTVRIS